MSLRWVSADLLTGVINCDLPSLESADPFRRTLGQYDTSLATLTVTPSIDPNWERGVLEGASVLCAYSGQPGSEVIEWAGVVIQAPRTLANTIVLSLVTGDQLLDWAFTGNYSVTATDQNTIVAALIARVASFTGLPLTGQLVGGAGTVRDLQILDTDDKTCYVAMQALMALQGGPEWTVHWVWTHNPELIVPVCYYGNRIGSAAVAGLAPAVTFETGDMSDLTVPHGWGEGEGASVVTATTSGQGTTRPQATSTATVLHGRPKREYRYSPAASIVGQTLLLSYASRALGVLQNGNQSVAFTVRRDLPSRMLGVDWNLGDDIGYALSSPTIPNEVTGVQRCIGYETTDTTVKPILASPAIPS